VHVTGGLVYGFLGASYLRLFVLRRERMGTLGRGDFRAIPLSRLALNASLLKRPTRSVVVRYAERVRRTGSLLCASP
jgi:hypothetical protein